MGKLVPFVKGGGFMAKPTVFDVANYFLKCVDVESGSAMTHLKLQKLCYYAQAWNLVFNSKPLFDNDFEAWTHGPVCPDLWQEYKKYKSNNILPNDEELYAFTDEELETLEAVWEAYGAYDGKYLEELTHQEAPWLEARGNCEPGDRCNNRISQLTMKNYYKQLLDKYGQEK